MKNMKKMLTLIASMCVALSAVSATASAQEYEKASVSEPYTWENYGKEISDGIKEGRYFADFDGNGTFDPVDAMLLSKYYASVATLGETSTIDDIDWNDENFFMSFNGFPGSLTDNYETYDIDGESFVTFNLNNEMLENVRKYGDINGDGVIFASDASILLNVYYCGFEVGDVNADNSVNAFDASSVLSYYSAKSTNQTFNPYIETAMEILADANGDGVIDAGDATAILSMYSELAVSE